MNKESKKLRVGGILFALFILFLGIFSLITGTSLVVGLLRLAALWPLLVIGLGVWLVFKGLDQEKVGAVVLAVILVAALYMTFYRVQPPLESFEEREIPSGVSSLDVSVVWWAGKFTIGSTSDYLYSTKGSKYPMESYLTTPGKTAYLDISMEEKTVIPFTQSGNEYFLYLNDTFPITIEADMGAVSCSFDLSALKIEELTIDGGLSSLEITFGETNATVEINMGLSSVTIHVPQSVGVKIYSEGLVSLSVPSDWVKIDGGYKSPNYDTALYKIEIDSTIGIGSIEISYV